MPTRSIALNKAAQALGRLAKGKTSEAKKLSSVANANKPPKEGKKPRGRPKKPT